MENLCVVSQEAIAWGRSLSLDLEHHVDDCQRCTTLRAEICLIDDQFRENLGVLPPPDFVDRVMARIDVEEISKSFLDMFVIRLVDFSRLKAFEIGMASAASALGIFSLIRFFLVFIIPSTT